MIVGIPIRKIVRLGTPVLREPARRLTPAEIAAPEVQRLVDEMAASMAEYEGVGIAANQAGEGVSCFLMGLAPDNPRHPAGIELTVVFNPEARLLGERSELDWEGCLSVPGLRGQVPRARGVELFGLDRRGRELRRVYEGFPARVVQHEVDHLDGLVYLDRMQGLATLSYVEEASKRARPR